MISVTMIKDILTIRARASSSSLFLGALIVSGCVTKFKLDSAYGCRRSLPDGMVTQYLFVCHST